MALSRLLSRQFKKNLVDPATGLSARDKANVTDAWAQFRQDVRKNAISLFEALFTRYPEYQKLFVGFDTVPPKDLHKSPRAVAHALAVVYFFTSIVDHIDDTPTVVELIRKNARNHTRRPVFPEHFVNIGHIIIEQLQAGMMRPMTSNGVNSWLRFFALHDQITRQVYKELSEATVGS